MTQICLKYYLLGSKECTVASPKSTVLGAKKLGPCLDPKFHPQISLCKKKILITSKCRHMHVVLNIDEITN
jgi:hypothetical protein